MGLFSRSKKKSEEKLELPPMPLPQRNDVCWCGSGQKYKKCHLDADKIVLAEAKRREEEARCSPVYG